MCDTALMKSTGTRRLSSLSALSRGVAAFVIVLLGCATAQAADSDPRGDTRVSPAHHIVGGFRNPKGKAHGEGVSAWTMFSFLARRIGSSLVPPGANGVPARVRPDRALLDGYELGDPPTATWIGHSTVLVQLGGVSFLTDPTWSSTASPTALGPKRYVKPALAMRELPPISFAVVSHNHYDHLHLGTLERLAAGGTRIFVPLANKDIVTGADLAPELVTELDWWQSTVYDGLRITCVPAQHWSRRGLFDENRSLWAGWVVEGEGKVFYFAGDTAMFDGFAEIAERIGPPDLAALPIGAYQPVEIMKPSHLNPEEAVQAALELRAKRTLAVHFGTFDLTDEPVDEPPRRYLAASERAGRGAEVDWVSEVGGTWRW